LVGSSKIVVCAKQATKPTLIANSTKDDMYYSGRKLTHALNRLQHNSELILENQQAILDFINAMLAQGIKPIRLNKEIYILTKISNLLEQPFQTVQRKDMEKLFGIIQTSNYSEWSKQEYRIILKRFYKWYLGNEETYPLCISWVKTKEPKNNILPEELLTEEEVQRLVQSVQFVRDKAFIHLLYESGARIGEMLTLKIKNITFAEPISSILVNGKTGQRRIPIIKCVPLLKDWLAIHPLKEDPNAFVWVKTNERLGNSRTQGMRTPSQEISYNSTKKILKNAFTLAKINKRCNPHMFRHSRATFLAKHLTEAQLKQFFGWTQSSDMAARYVHLSGRDLDSVILKIGFC
jgi:integrase